MKRKITELEEKLIDMGFKLSHKTYGGKKSQFVKDYVYGGEIIYFDEDAEIEIPVKVQVELEPKREKVNVVSIQNFLQTHPNLTIRYLRRYLEIALYCENEILRLVEE